MLVAFMFWRPNGMNRAALITNCVVDLAGRVIRVAAPFSYHWMMI
jgi:hypothetical protein